MGRECKDEKCGYYDDTTKSCILDDDKECIKDDDTYSFELD